MFGWPRSLTVGDRGFTNLASPAEGAVGFSPLKERVLINRALAPEGLAKGSLHERLPPQVVKQIKLH